MHLRRRMLALIVIISFYKTRSKSSDSSDRTRQNRMRTSPTPSRPRFVNYSMKTRDSYSVDTVRAHRRVTMHLNTLVRDQTIFATNCVYANVLITARIEWLLPGSRFRAIYNTLRSISGLNVSARQASVEERPRSVYCFVRSKRRLQILIFINVILSFSDQTRCDWSVRRLDHFEFSH